MSEKTKIQQELIQLVRTKMGEGAVHIPKVVPPSGRVITPGTLGISHPHAIGVTLSTAPLPPGDAEFTRRVKAARGGAAPPAAFVPEDQQQ